MKVNLKRLVSLIAAAALTVSSFSALTVSAENEPAAWTEYASAFTGDSSADEIVWHKRGDNKKGQWNLINNVLTITDDGTATNTSNNTVYGVAAVMKNIKPDTDYTITFEEKANITLLPKDDGTELATTNNGLYVGVDTLSTTAAETSAGKVTAAVTNRNNNSKKFVAHNKACNDADWETKSFTWTSGNTIKTEGHDTYAATVTFMFRDVVGSWKIRNLRIAETTSESSAHYLTYDTEKNPYGEFSVVKVADDNSEAPVTAATTAMMAGDKFKVNVTPNTGYTGTVKVKSSAGNIQPSDGIYTMPEGDADIGVTYARDDSPASRIAALNSAAVNTNGDVSGGGAGGRNHMVIAAGRIALLKFDLTGYKAEDIASAKLTFTNAKSNPNPGTKALFYVPNNNWSEGFISKTFNAVDAANTDATFTLEKLTKDAVFTGIKDDTTNETNKNYDVSSASTGVLKDYYVGAGDAQLSSDITDALKQAMGKVSGANIITLMIYSPFNTGLDVKSVFSADSIGERPSLEITAKTIEAELIHEGAAVKYEKFEDAYVNAEAGDTVKLLSDTTTSKGIAFDKGSLTIDGNGKTIHNGTNYISFKGSGELMLNNLTIDGTGNLEMQGNTKINSDNLTISRLQIYGSTIQSKGTLKNSAVDTLKSYSKLTLEDTTVKNITLPKIKAGSGDAPKITSNKDFKAESIVVEAIETVGESGVYTLFDGEYTPANVTINAPYNESYVYANGLIKDAALTTPHSITVQEGITASANKAVSGDKVTLSGNYAGGSLVVKSGEDSIPVTKDTDGAYSFVMPNNDVSVTGLINTSEKIYVVPKSVERVNGEGQSDTNNYYIHLNRGLGMTFDIPADMGIAADKEISSVKLHFIRSNTAGGQTTNIYDQTQSGFAYTGGAGYIAQYNGGSVEGQALSGVPGSGEYKLLFAYDESVTDNHGNDYYVVGSNGSKKPTEASQLPYLVYTFRDKAPDKTAPEYALQTDTQSDIFQYHYAGGTTEYNSGASTGGKAYDAYLWVPKNTAKGGLKGLVAVKMNLIEVPFVYSQMLRNALSEKNFGILFLVCQKDPYGYNNTLNGFYTKNDYKGDTLITDTTKFTTDGKDAAQILDEILTGLADASGYSEIKDKTPLITIGHSAASPFGYRSGNWNKDRIIAQIQMKNGMGAPDYNSNEGMVPGIPSLQYAAQYTEHAMGADRDRSVRDARWHIANERNAGGEYLVSHIIEWGSGHYDWSENATYMLTKYITKAIEARLPANYVETGTLNDLTGSGYLMKPFEKNGNDEQEAGYYRDYLQGWLSSGQSNAAASEADKKASFWFFDEEFASSVNKFTNYAIPESPDSIGTGVAGKTYSDNEPFMLMKDPSKSTWSNTPYTAPTLISAFTAFASNPFSRYGSNRFVNYTKMQFPNGNADNTANLGGYDTATVDTYYMSKVPSVVAGGKEAYDGTGNAVSYPQNTKAEFVPLIAPYEVVGSELLDMSGMTVDENSAEAANVASATRTTLRFHNNRVYFRSGNLYTLGEGYKEMDSYGFIKSPEVRGENGFVTSTFKATSSQMNIPYVNKGTAQTLEIAEIANVSVKDKTENPMIDINYTSSDEDLQKYTDVFVEYGPARAVRTINETDGSYTWKIEVLLDEIPNDAQFPIEVNVVASNLGKWEKTYGATVSQTFNIVEEEAVIEGITVTPSENLVYNKEAQALAQVTGVQTGDSVAYKINNQTVSELTAANAGSYDIEVTVSRSGCADYTWTGTVVIAKAAATITAASEQSADYDGEAKTASAALNHSEGTLVYEITKDGDIVSEMIDAGEYTVEVSAEETANYFVPESKTVTFTINQAKITGVTVTGGQAQYDGAAHDLITITGTLDGDEIIYKVDAEEETSVKPSFTDIGTYSVKVTVSRGDNYIPYEQTVTVTVDTEPVITGIEVTPYNSVYDGQEHEALIVSGMEDGDTVVYVYNEEELSEIPKITNAGEYEITVNISRDGYADYSQKVKAVIEKAGAVITADASQFADYDGGVKTVTAELNHQETQLIYVIEKNGENVSEMTEAGEYTVVISAEETENYKAPQPVTVIFKINMVKPAEPEIVIGDVSADGALLYVEISVNNSNEETEKAVIIAALYSGEVCVGVSFVNDGKAVFNTADTSGMVVKAFMWSALSGEGAMQPLMQRVDKTI